MVDPREFPDEVRKLYEENGGAISNLDDGFFYQCPECKGASVCRVERTVQDNCWLTHCETEGCKLHGELEIAVVDLEPEEMAMRKQNPARYHRDRTETIAGFNRMLRVAAEIARPDTDYAKLLDRMVDMIRTYVYIGREEAVITALWVAHTWCLPASDHTPYLYLRSALPQEGKSVMMEIASYLVARPLVIHDPTPAAIAHRVTRSIMMTGDAPTFLWDEIDTVFERRPELREYINMGHQRDGAVVLRANSEYEVYSPKMLAGLTNLTGGRMGTIRTRSFRFDMMEPLVEERPLNISDHRDDIRMEADEIKLMLNVMAERHMEYLRQSRPEFPEDLDMRGRDISRPLFAIADMIGGEWPDKARNAVSNIRHRQNANEMAEDKVLLLFDIKAVMGLMRKIPTAVLVERLRERTDSPWHAITARKLAVMLHDFMEYPGGPRIKPVVMRDKDGKQFRGYRREQFRDAWNRYKNRLK